MFRSCLSPTPLRSAHQANLALYINTPSILQWTLTDFQEVVCLICIGLRPFSPVVGSSLKMKAAVYDLAAADLFMVGTTGSVLDADYREFTFVLGSLRMRSRYEVGRNEFSSS